MKNLATNKLAILISALALLGTPTMTAARGGCHGGDGGWNGGGWHRGGWACRYTPLDMSDGSAIEWTDATWNPVRGCTKITPGCTHCYASTFAERFRGVPGHPYEQGFDLRLVPARVTLDRARHLDRPASGTDDQQGSVVETLRTNVTGDDAHDNLFEDQEQRR